MVAAHGCCTDNASNNTNAWQLLHQKYPNKHFYGCICHALHLLVKDIGNSIKLLKDTVFVATEISKIIKRSHLLSAKFNNLIKDQKEKKRNWSFHVKQDGALYWNVSNEY